MSEGPTLPEPGFQFGPASRAWRILWSVRGDDEVVDDERLAGWERSR